MGQGGYAFEYTWSAVSPRHSKSPWCRLGGFVFRNIENDFGAAFDQCRRASNPDCRAEFSYRDQYDFRLARRRLPDRSLNGLHRVLLKVLN